MDLKLSNICRMGRKLCAIFFAQNPNLAIIFLSGEFWQKHICRRKFDQSLLAGQKWLYGVVREAKMNRCWRVGDSPGRGEGVFATRRIAAGEVVSSGPRVLT